MLHRRPLLKQSVPSLWFGHHAGERRIKLIKRVPDTPVIKKETTKSEKEVSRKEVKYRWDKTQ